MENWKIINDFADYEISDEGRVYSHKAGRCLKPTVMRNGYLRTCLTQEGKHHYLYIHRLVLEHFGPEQPADTTCDHIDRNVNNNHISNLRWATRKEQSANSVGNGGVRVRIPVDIYKNGELVQQCDSIHKAAD